MNLVRHTIRLTFLLGLVAFLLPRNYIAEPSISRRLFFEKFVTARQAPFAGSHPSRAVPVSFSDLELLQGFVLPTAATMAGFSYV